MGTCLEATSINMRAFIVLAVLPMLALANTGSFVKVTSHGQTHGYNHGDVHHAAPVPAPYAPAPAPAPAPYKPAPAPYKPAAPVYHPAPAPYKPAPVYHKPAPAYGHHAPAYGHPHHGYGYEEPKHNCSVVDVTETAEVCTPAFEQSCANVDLPIKKIIDTEYCYTITRTVCTESIEEIPNEICTYSYRQKTEDTTAKTVEVVTVCAPGHHGGYGHHGYGHGGYGGYGGYGKYCKEVAQTTSYNSPVVTPVDIPVEVAYPEPIKTCVNKPISLPRVSCADLTEDKCIVVPEIMEDIASVEKCDTQLAAPNCNAVELTLPKQVCIELVYGYAHEHAPKPAPAYGHH